MGNLKKKEQLIETLQKSAGEEPAEKAKQEVGCQVKKGRRLIGAESSGGCGLSAGMICYAILDAFAKSRKSKFFSLVTTWNN